MDVAEIAYLPVGDLSIAYRLRRGIVPTIIFFPGYASDMEGAKALALDGFARERGIGMVRFDYSGTGSSSGSFADGTLGLWLEQSLAVIDQLTDGPLVLVGSSMGGWIALHAALRRSERVSALIGIAAAPDFTNWGFASREAAEQQGIAASFWKSGQERLLLESDIAIECPVRLLHGEKDPDVPLDVAFRLMRALRSADVQLNVIKGGGHRLSEAPEIDAILRTVAEFTETE